MNLSAFTVVYAFSVFSGFGVFLVGVIFCV